MNEICKLGPEILTFSWQGYSPVNVRMVVPGMKKVECKLGGKKLYRTAEESGRHVAVAQSGAGRKGRSWKGEGRKGSIQDCNFCETHS